VSDFPVLSTLIAVPFLGAAATLCVPERRAEAARAVGYLTTALTLGLAGLVIWDFRAGVGGFQFVEEHRLSSTLGVSWIVGVDGYSVFLVAITALLFLLGLLASETVTDRAKAYTFWFLLLEGTIIGVFCSLDLISFFVFWELMLVPMWFLIAGWGSAARRYAAMKFFLYTATGSAFLLAAILALGFLHRADVGELTFDLRALAAWDGPSAGTARWLFAGFMVAFAVKAPIWPLHTWLPDVHTEAPTAGSVILAGVIIKMGTYGILRFCFDLFPGVAVDAAPFMLTLAVVGIIYGSIVAAMQRDAKRVIAYSSVAHMGFVVLGLFSLTVIGVGGATFTMLSHPLTTGSLFLLIGMLYERRHSRRIDDFGGVATAAPLLTGAFLVATFAGIGLPGLSGFVGEFLSLLGAFLAHRWWAVAATAGVILAAVYMLWMVRRMFAGPPRGPVASFRDLSWREAATVVPLLALSLLLGVHPRPVLERIEPTAARTIERLTERTGYRPPAADQARTTHHPAAAGRAPAVRHGDRR
jgi:NADH-quinone oxidoreductase subunit M